MQRRLASDLRKAFLVAGQLAGRSVQNEATAHAREPTPTGETKGIETKGIETKGIETKGITTPLVVSGRRMVAERPLTILVGAAAKYYSGECEGSSRKVDGFVSKRRSPASRSRSKRPAPRPEAKSNAAEISGAASYPGYADMSACVAAVVGPLLLYVITMPRTVALEDDGLFLIVGKFLGVGHPPGYPVHTVISNLFLKIPWGSEAFLGHLLSGVFGALACGAVYACARLSGVAPAAALIGAWLFAGSEHFWAQAIITEVYTLNALCFFSILAALLYLRRNPSDGRVWAAAAFLFGMSLANHWPLMVVASPALLLAVVPLWRDVVARLRLLAGVFLSSVLVPYVWLVWRSRQEPTFSFPGPLRTLDDIFAHVTRQTYREVDSSVSADWSDRFEFLQWFSVDIAWQLTLPGFLLALVGLTVLLVRPPWKRIGSKRGRDRLPHRHDVLDWVGRCAGPVAFLTQSILLIWLLNFDYDFFQVQVFRAYPLVCYGLLAIWAAIGLQHTTSWIGERLSWSAVPRSLLMTAVGLAMVGWSVSSHWDANDRAGSDFAQRYVDMVFDILPPDTVLLTRGDEVVLPLGYHHFVAGQRPDLRLVEVHGLIFPDNLYGPVTDTPVGVQQSALRQFLEKTERPVFHTYRTNEVDHGRTVGDYGFLREVLDGDAPEAGDEREASIELRPHEAAEAYFVGLVEQEYHHGWELVARSHQIIDYSQYLGYVLLSGSPELIERTAPLRELAEQDYYGLNGMASVLARLGDPDQLEQTVAWLETAETLRDDALTKQAEAELYNNMGTALWRQGQTDEAIALFERSRGVMAHPDNPGVQYLEQLNR